MTILDTDIKLLAASRQTDNPDGGGRITGNVLQSGVDNNLFDGVADLDRATGAVSLRKFAAAVQSAGDEKYLKSRLMISRIPADTASHAVLFDPAFDDDERSDATTRVASYLAPGGTYAGTLYGNHLAGMKTVLLLQRTTAPVPAVGDVLYLVADESLSGERNQYVRASTVDTLERTFTDESGDFVRLQVTMGISDALQGNFAGFESMRFDTSVNYTGKTRVRETIVADAAQYFGTKRLETAAALGSFEVKTASVFGQLLPGSQSETPISNANPSPTAQTGIGSSALVTFLDYSTWSPSVNFSLPGAATPGSVSILMGASTLTDSGGKLLIAGAEVGYIDYTSGTLYSTDSDFSSAKEVTYRPAGTALRAPQSTGLEITLANRSTSFSWFMDPPPVPGTTSVSYRAQGRWYVLTDNGSGALLGGSTSFGAGSINYNDGTVVFSVGALPDVGSSVVMSWATASQETQWPVVNLKASQVISLSLAADKLIQPGSVSLSWPNNGGGINTASDSAAVGVLAGQATGLVRVGRGQIEFAPNELPPVGALISVSYTEGSKTSDLFAHPSRDGTGKVPVTAALGSIVPGSLEVEWSTLTSDVVLDAYTAAQLEEMGVAVGVDPTHIARDNGAGAVVLNGATIGTVNYATGAVLFQPDVTIKIPRPNYSLGPAVGASRWRLNFAGLTYVDAPSLYPNDASGSVTLRYNSAVSGSAKVETHTFAPSLALLGDVQAPLLPGALALGLGDEVMGDSSTGVLRSRIAGAWQVRGSINYVNASALLTSWPAGAANSFSRLACASSLGESLSSDFVFRTALAPLRPGLFSIRYNRAGGGVQTVTAAQDGTISAAGVLGSINFGTGVCALAFGSVVTAAGNESEPWYSAGAVVGGLIFKPSPIVASTLRYSATAYSYLPLSADQIGLDPVRLPQDGRVPLYKPGRVICVHHTQDTAPQTVSNGTVVNTGRTLLAWAKVFGADGLEITSGFAKDLDAGAVSFTNVAGMSQPIKVRSRIETEALCLDAQIDGTLKLRRALSHNFPAVDTLVSSVLEGGTLQSGVAEPFSQQTWTNEWSDDILGTPILAQYDATAHPIVVNNLGAITQAWSIIFTSTTEFRLVGQTRGQIITGNTASVLSPVNPATGEPYFVLQPGGWGGGWSAGNVLRFNTRGAIQVAWCARTVEQSDPRPGGETDQIEIEVRGSIDT